MECWIDNLSFLEHNDSLLFGLFLIVYIPSCLFILSGNSLVECVTLQLMIHGNNSVFVQQSLFDFAKI